MSEPQKFPVKIQLDILITWGFFIIPYLLDRIFKLYTQNITTEPIHFWVFGFFSSFSKLDISAAPELPVHITHSIVAILFCILSIFTFAFINYIFTYKHLLIRISFGLFLSGFSNLIIDYILTNRIINNISFMMHNSYMPFSLAILTLLTGASMFFYTLIIDRKTILQKDSLRKTILLKSEHQNQFIKTAFYTFSLIYFIIFILMFAYFFFSLSPASTDSSLNFILIKNFLLLILFSYLLSVSILFILTVLYSHRIYGPIYGFQSYMRSLFEENKKDQPFKTRKKDHFKELEKIAEYIRTRLIRKL